ncbi:hypothetical protein C8R45DRAFT_947872 [Mycena sanguinolenta]|nr:hypothetical protein C8R45DRAFT_947872 [Mycena sanguinolenta]
MYNNLGAVVFGSSCIATADWQYTATVVKFQSFDALVLSLGCAMGHGKISASDGVDLDIIIYTLRFNDRVSSPAHGTWCDTSQIIEIKLLRQAFQKQGTSNEDSDDEEQDNAGDGKWLAADIKKWHQQQQDICPQVIPLVVTEPYTSPELDKLFLPSDFTSAELGKLGLEALGAEELKLQQGQANAICSLSAKVQWHCAQADMEQWQEELEIVGQEFRRAVQGFSKMHSV